jgi:hypothetical protein
MAIVIRRHKEQDEVENFDSGDDALNNYLKRHAWTNQQKSSIGVSYVALDEDAPRTVLGYFTFGHGKRASQIRFRKSMSAGCLRRSAADFNGPARRGSAIRRPGTWPCADFGSAPHHLSCGR